MDRHQWLRGSVLFPGFSREAGQDSGRVTRIVIDSRAIGWHDSRAKAKQSCAARPGFLMVSAHGCSRWSRAVPPGDARCSFTKRITGSNRNGSPSHLQIGESRQRMLTYWIKGKILYANPTSWFRHSRSDLELCFVSGHRMWLYALNSGTRRFRDQYSSCASPSN